MQILENEWALAKPTRAQYKWQDNEIGMFIHWFPYLEKDIREMDSNRYTLAQDKEYQKKLASTFTMSEMNTDRWAETAVNMGAKYIVFVAKHNKGFCRWQTETDNEFSMRNSPYQDGKGDIVKELSESCKKYGIKLGIYICGDTLVYNARHGGIMEDQSKQEYYTGVYRQWITELLSRYGEICEVWFDSSLLINVSDILAKYAPDAMVFQSVNATIRWVGNEEGWAYYPAWNGVKRYDALTGISTQKEDDPDNGDIWMPLECDVPIRREWCYDPSPANTLCSLDKLLDMYYKSVGRGTTLLLNIGPHYLGDVIPEDYDRVKEFGDEIRRRFDNPLAEASGEGEFVEIDFGKETSVDHFVTMEDIRYGERVRKYVIEGFDGKEWKVLANGSSIGHKKIDFFPEAKVTKIRFRCLVSVGTPLIRSAKAFYAGVIPQGYTNNDETNK